jgi:hypothetical protein
MLGQVCHPQFYSLDQNEYLEVVFPLDVTLTRRLSFTSVTAMSDCFTLNSQSHTFETLQSTENDTSKESRNHKVSSYNIQNDMNYVTLPSARNSSRYCAGW